MKIRKNNQKKEESFEKVKMAKCTKTTLFANFETKIANFESVEG